jgi:hypothetical protein
LIRVYHARVGMFLLNKSSLYTAICLLLVRVLKASPGVWSLLGGRTRTRDDGHDRPCRGPGAPPCPSSAKTWTFTSHWRLPPCLPLPAMPASVTNLLNDGTAPDRCRCRRVASCCVVSCAGCMLAALPGCLPLHGLPLGAWCRPTAGRRSSRQPADALPLL